jgi:hypothetical protein
MRCVSAKLIPRLLTQDQTEYRATASRELLHRAENDLTFLPSIITGDESWLRPSDKTNVTMEDAVVTSAEESEASPVKCQENADRFL